MPVIYYIQHQASLATKFKSSSQQAQREILSEALYFFLGHGFMSEVGLSAQRNVIFSVKALNNLKITIDSDTIIKTNDTTVEQLIKLVCLANNIQPPEFINSVTINFKMQRKIDEVNERNPALAMKLIALQEFIRKRAPAPSSAYGSVSLQEFIKDSYKDFSERAIKNAEKADKEFLKSFKKHLYNVAKDQPTESDQEKLKRLQNNYEKNAALIPSKPTSRTALINSLSFRRSSARSSTSTATLSPKLS